MQKICVLGFIVLLLAGCASAPPALTSVTSKNTAANVMPEAPLAEEGYRQQAARPKATGTEEDARRHFLRGMAALEMAKTKDDLVLAIDEFCMATQISPKMAIAWYNMGKAQEQYGIFKEAMESYRQYLANAPDAPDAQAVRDEMVKLEFRQERIEKSRFREGFWMDDEGSRYYLTVDGNNLTLKALEYVTKDQIIKGEFGNFPVMLDNSVPVEYQLLIHGNLLSGKWNRAPATVEACQVPADAAAVTGEMIDSEGKMILHHERSRFRTLTTSFLGIGATCKSVNAQGRSTAKVSIYGPHKKGGLGVELSGFSKWGEGLFADIGWQGRLKLRNVNPGSPAYEAGLRDEDEILAIDGAAVKDLSAGQAWLRLSGEIGTPVTLEIWRKSGKETSIIHMNRVKVFKP
jgi:hypothetical protein